MANKEFDMNNEFSLHNLLAKDPKELYAFANELAIPDYSGLSKKELALAIMRTQEEKQGFFNVEGILDIVQDGTMGFLRPINYSPSNEDVYVSNSQIRRFGMRNGDKISGPARPPKSNERYYGLMQVSKVNGRDAELAKSRDHFASLTPLYPDMPIKLEYSQSAIVNRMIDITSPIGFGQRGLIVAPPKAGKTTIIKEIANGISKNYPEVELIVLLIDERPEEVTDMERSVKGEVVSSTFDQTPENHTRIAELVIQRGMRLVEEGRDVVILLDSITRLARAYNLTVKPSGRTLSGGLDPASFYFPKRFFGAARNIEHGGSLTILATALVDTGSRMDDMIYEEFKGTGNMELQLSRELAERRIFPAIDIKKSGTRKEELLLDANTMSKVWNLRNMMSQNSLNYTEQLIRLMRQTDNNDAFLEELDRLTQK